MVKAHVSCFIVYAVASTAAKDTFKWLLVSVWNFGTFVTFFFTFLLVSLHSMNNYVSVLSVKTQVPYFIVCVVANTAAKGTCKYPHPYLRSAWQARKHFSLNALSRDHV